MKPREYKLDPDHQTLLCQAVWSGNKKVVDEMLQTSPETFFEPSKAPIICFKDRVFGAGTTPLQVLFYTLDPMMDDVLDHLSKAGFKERIDAHRKAYSFTGLMTAVNNEPMHQEKFYSFAPMIQNLSGPRIATDFHRALGNMPGWVSHLICNGNISTSNDLGDSIKSRVSKPFFRSQYLSWEEFLTSEKFCGLKWENSNQIFLLVCEPIVNGKEENLDSTARTFSKLSRLYSFRCDDFYFETLYIDVISELTLPVIKSTVTIPENFYCSLSGQLIKTPAVYYDAEKNEHRYCEQSVLESYCLSKNAIRHAQYNASLESARLESRIKHFKAFHPELFYNPKTLAALPDSLSVAGSVEGEFKIPNLDNVIVPHAVSTASILAVVGGKGIACASLMPSQQINAEEKNPEKSLLVRVREAFDVSEDAGNAFVDGLKSPDARQLLKEVFKPSCNSSPPPYEANEDIYRPPSPVS